jgi:DNA-binding response OmpR family regulator
MVQLNQRILVVDDDPLLADTLVQILKNQGFDAIAVYSGQEAVVAARGFQPDSAVMDVMMTGLNGFEAAQSILEHVPACNFLLLSGRPEAGQIIAQERTKGNHFDVLAKPVHPQEVLDVLKSHRSKAKILLEN